MTKEYVLNELSIFEIDARRHDVFSVLERFLELCRVAGGARISLWRDLKDKNKEVSQLFDEMIRAVDSENPKKKEVGRRIRSFFDKAESFAHDLLEDVRFDDKIAHGLGRALRLRGLALSLDSSDKNWRDSFVQVHIHAHVEASRDKGTDRSENVRHAAKREHLGAHLDWSALDAKDRLRILLEVFPVTHVAASKYRAKHVKGTTNEQRRKNARVPAGSNQYLAERNGAPVTDEVITGWEKEALERVKQGLDCHLESHGNNTFHVYCDLGEGIGYDSVTGELISWVRVEWTSGGNVHSHPRRPRDQVKHAPAKV